MIQTLRIQQKREFIQGTIKDIGAMKTESNQARIDTEIKRQKQRIAWLDKYEQMSDAKLIQIRETFRNKLPPEMWENRKSAVTSLLDPLQIETIYEVAIIDFLLGEYDK